MTKETSSMFIVIIDRVLCMKSFKLMESITVSMMRPNKTYFQGPTYSPLPTMISVLCSSICLPTLFIRIARTMRINAQPRSTFELIFAVWYFTFTIIN